MGCFEKAAAHSLVLEGEFSNRPEDPGGPTNYGISLRWLKKQGLLGDLDDDGDVDIDDILLMDAETATRYYRAKFWDKYGYDRLKSCDVAMKIFDTCINTGPHQAHKILQRVVNDLGGTLNVDGKLGPLTASAVNRADPDALLEGYRVEQARFYKSLIKSNPEMVVFRDGWLRRAAA